MRQHLLTACALTALAPLACGEERQPRLICHNSNCVEPAEPTEDDTLEALEASLALEDDAGRPLIDGMEIDTFWYGEGERCLFAHDLAHVDESADAPEAVDAINAHLIARRAAGAPLTRDGTGRFAVFIELKGHVGESKAEKHSAAQRAQHASCVLGLAASLDAAAQANDYTLELVFTSFEPELLAALRADEDFATLEASSASQIRLGALQGIPRPLDSQTRPLEDFSDELGVEVASVHPHWTRHAALQNISSRGWMLGLWMFSVVPETYDAIERYQPDYITTSEARALAGWLERR